MQGCRFIGQWNFSGVFGIKMLIPSCVQMNATWYKAMETGARKFLKKLGFPVFQKLWRTAFNAN
jgi:hypothetical protein